MPLTQSTREAVGCDALCVGAMTSTRSALSLVGAPLVGRVSDSLGRKAALGVATLASLCSSLLQARASTKVALWVALVPSSLLSHQFDALKAVLADAYQGGGDAALAGAQGALGMSAGLGFLGVALGGVLATPLRATLTACVAAAFSTACVVFVLPTSRPASTLPPPTRSDGSRATAPGVVSSLQALASLASARSPGGLTVLSLRFLMGLSFHSFMAVWQTSLKRRFPDFGPSDHARFMTFIGLGYAVSQGLAGRALRLAGPGGEQALLIACCACLSLGRVAAVACDRLPLVYAAYAPVIVALGLINAAVTGAVSKVAPPGERGTFFGVVSAVESVCGVVGPVLGGVASLRGTPAVCGVVCGLYALAAAIIARRWGDLAAPRVGEKRD